MIVWAIFGLIAVFCVQVFVLWRLILLNTCIAREEKNEGIALFSKHLTDAAAQYERDSLCERLHEAEESVDILYVRLEIVEKELCTLLNNRASVTALQRLQNDMVARIENTDRGLRHIKRIFAHHEHGHTKVRLQ